MNACKTFRRRPGRLLDVLRTFNLRPVSTGFGHEEASVANSVVSIFFNLSKIGMCAVSAHSGNFYKSKIFFLSIGEVV